MKKGVILLVALALVLSVAAQDVVEKGEEVLIEDRAGITPDSALYVLDRAVDNVNLAVRTGSGKASYALKVKEERVSEAAVMVSKGDSGGTRAALQGAGSASAVLEGGFNPALNDDVEQNIQFSKEVLDSLKAALPDDLAELNTIIDEQLSQEEKLEAARDIVKKIGDYCEALAHEDYELMEQDETCDPSNAPDWLQEYIQEELKKREEEAAAMVLGMTTTCILTPKECDCSQIPVKKHQRKCVEAVQLQIRCEYEGDMDACEELRKMPPPSVEDMPPFLSFLQPKFDEIIKQKEQEMFRKFAPEECSDVDTPEECMRVMRELYGAPYECAGLSDEECDEVMLEMGPQEPQEMPELPEECRGQPPQECFDIMTEKYGLPEECEGLSREECEELTRSMPPPEERGEGPYEHERPEECEGLSREECEELTLPEECKERDIRGTECDELMKDIFIPEGMFRECEGGECEESEFWEGERGWHKEEDWEREREDYEEKAWEEEKERDRENDWEEEPEQPKLPTGQAVAELPKFNNVVEGILSWLAR